VTADPGAGEVIRVERLTVRAGDAVALSNVSLSVPRGAVYALLGRTGAGKTTLVRCVLGQERPDAGRVFVFGEDARGKRRRLASRIATSVRGLRDRHELLVLDDPDGLRDLPRDPPRTVLAATDAPERVAGIATHFGILKLGRLVIDAPVDALRAGIRRVRYVSRMTETRTSFGTELDEFDAVGVRVRGWGIEAIVSNFEPAAFDRFRTIDGVEEAAAESLTLEEAFQALA
jgi:ABC-type multidrug transport system ATPase subunit